MLKVAICDDNEDFTKRIEEHTEHFSHENNIDVKVSRFISGPQLMLSYFYRKYDIIFLIGNQTLFPTGKNVFAQMGNTLEK